jgi:hypothetical protein
MRLRHTDFMWYTTEGAIFLWYFLQCMDEKGRRWSKFSWWFVVRLKNMVKKERRTIFKQAWRYSYCRAKRIKGTIPWNKSMKKDIYHIMSVNETHVGSTVLYIRFPHHLDVPKLWILRFLTNLTFFCTFLKKISPARFNFRWWDLIYF